MLSGENYRFLRDNEHLGNNLVLLTLGGSYAYGTNVEGSDVDIRGVAKNRECDLLGISNFEVFCDKGTDTTIYAIKKVVGLLLNCNPNVIELFGTKDEHIFLIKKEGKMLKDNIGLFLSKKVARSFGGYAASQLRRLQNGLMAGDVNQKDKERHILGSLINQMGYIEDRYKEMGADGVRVYLGESDKEGFEEEILIDINLRGYPLRDLKNIYSEMINVVENYDKLAHRNNKKSDAGLYKHAMHLIRLLIMGTEILEGKGVNTYRENEREFLIDIREGRYSFSDIFLIVDEYDKKFRYAVENTCLGDKVDIKKIEELVMEINRVSLGGGGGVD